MAVKLNQHDLQFILDQIKIAEAHVAGTPLDQQIAQPHLPYGLRTVDGSYNNLLEGRELWGADDQVMPRMMQPFYVNEGDDSFHGMINNNDYGVVGEPTAGMTENGGHTGNVVDADPRIISNLISDQTLNNPAAIAAALQYAEYDALPLADAVAAVRAEYATYLQSTATVLADGDPTDAPTAAQQDALALAKDALDQTLLDTYGIEMDGNSISLPNVAPDEGLSAPFNGWMTFFGQFFDHGLDLIHKGDNGTIYMPLTADDPLVTHGPDGIPDSGDEVNVNMPLVLTRLTPTVGPGADGVLGDDPTTVGVDESADDTADARNKTTPFVDQNQTYTSHPSHQVFLRHYDMVMDPVLGHEVPLASGTLLGGVNGGLATWADVKLQARDKLGIELDDRDVFGVPLILTDPYGEFIRDANGFPQVVVNIGPDLIPNTADDVTISGTGDAPLHLALLNEGRGPVRTSHAFLDDIAHNAVPILTPGAAGQPAILQPDTNSGTDPIGDPVEQDAEGNPLYDNELLDAHFIVGDGRGNENIGLTAVHHVFHAEHNRQVEVNKAYILEIASSGNAEDIAFLNEWLLDPVSAGFDPATLQWDGERLFQMARFATEMQYQHLVFEEFGRKVQPNIDLFVFNTVTDVNPAIFAEFAHTVYRFGHSMLTDHLKLLPLDEDGNPILPTTDSDGDGVIDVKDWGVDVSLIEAFLNPVLYDQGGTISAEQAAGAIFRGMTYVRGSAIDEFVVDNLRNNLLGLPLDLPAINIARGRDAGVPPLNIAREQLYDASNSTWLKPYVSWADFGANLKTPASIINFIAAYGLHESLVGTEAAPLSLTLAEKREAATLLVLGDGNDADGVTIRGVTYADRADFLNSTGTWNAGNSGLNTVDLWIGGLAEKIMPFGGMLGSTFNAVFELQLENLQEGDRFYYLSRTQGLNLLNELENNAFSKLIAANTDMTHPGVDGTLGTEDDVVNFHVGVDSFARHDVVLEVDESKQIDHNPEGDDPFLEAIRAKVERDDPNTPGADANYLRFTGGEHAVMGGTAGDDTIIGGDGDDAIWGEGGNDRIEGGHGVDLIVGGYGDDIITDTGDTGDFIKGEGGNDVIANSNGLDVVMSGDGKDAVFAGVDATEVFAGEGDDFILGGLDHDFILGNEGDDWMEGGDGFDVLNGDNSELFFNSTILGHDVAFAGANENDFDMESGDDIMVQGESVMRNEGMFGFDWAIHKGSAVAADSDMRIPIFTTVFDDILRDRFDQTEGLSGWIHNDVLRGDDRGSTEEIEVEFSLENHGLTQAGVNRIDGMRELLGDLIADAPTDPNVDLEDIVAWAQGNILLGGDGNDTFEGRGADDFIHGDAWLNVRIRITGEDRVANEAANEIATVDTLTHVFSAEDVDTVANPETAAWIGKSLSKLLLDGVVKPGQMHIVREIKYDEDTTNNTDTAIFAGNQSWYEITHLEGDKVRVTRREDENIEPQVDEGTDILVGIERIQFSDGMYTIRETGNSDPTGRLVLEGLPATEGQELKVNADNIRDLNNPDGMVEPGSITYRWQIERNDGTGDYIAIPGVSGDTFVPDDEHAGLRIRVIGTYVDSAGVTEIVSSAPSDIVVGVNDEPEGPLLVSDMSPTEGQTLTATVAFTDADGLSDAFEEALLTYQWQYSATGVVPVPPADPDIGWTNIAAEDGGNARSFVPGPDLVGMHLRMVVIYDDDLLNRHRVNSDVTEIVGNYIASDDGTIDGGNGDVEGGTDVGADWVEGGNSANAISGGDGGDVLNGGGGNDTLNGDAGDDLLTGGGGDDTVNGGDGNDTIVYGAGDGSDTISGGAGNDTLRIVQSASGENDDTVGISIAGGAIVGVAGMASLSSVERAEMDLFGGTDKLAYTTAEAVSANLLTGSATGFSFIRGVENVTGGSGNDTLQGNSLGNVLEGEAGDDTIRGGVGDDSLAGGDGADDLRGDEGDDVLNGGAGNDRIDGGTGTDTASYEGAAGPVTVTLSDFVNAEGQPRQSFEEQDTLGAGLDRLVSIENLTGSAFDDTLIGDDGTNVLDGGAGNDTMTGGTGDDTYVVSQAGDVVAEDLGGGTDTVRSTLGNYMLATNVENLVLGAGANIGVGNTLDNKLTGNAGNNNLNGFTGSDTVVLDGHVTDYTFSAFGAHTAANSAAGGNDILVSIESLEIGGNLYNIVRGTNAADTLATAVLGTAGDDILFGFNGTDNLQGSGGNDILVGGNHADFMYGGAGDDVYVVNNFTDFVGEAGGGIDTIYSAVTRNLSNNAQVVGDVENLTLFGTLDMNAIGNALDNVLTGNEGNNQMFGLVGNDALNGGAGEDLLNGGAGDDILEGGAGDDTLDGGAGIDTAVFAGAPGNYSFGFDGSGLASVINNAGGETDSLANIERLQFGDGEVLNIVIGDGDISSADPGVIFGGVGNDTITGSDGDDVIVGGAGDDLLYGTDVGDGGDNAVDLPLDDDTFIWNAGDGSDTINGGFEGAEGDRLVINGNAEAEIYRIYTIDEAIARIAFEDGDVGGDFEAEIVITRQVAGGEETVIAAMTEIEEISINGSSIAGNGNGEPVEVGSDIFEVYGDFDTTTSLRPNTITIVGSSGDDKVDISSLLSAHRIVFKTKGGNDTIIGTLRPQDVVELPNGTTISDYKVTVDDETGMTKLAGDGYALSFMADGMPQFVSGDGEENVDDVAALSANVDDTPPAANNEDGGGDEAASAVVGTSDADVFLGTDGGEKIMGQGGNDKVFGDGGSDDILGGDGSDMLFGDDGKDRIFGDEGDDYINAGGGNDTVFGGAGDDRIVAEDGDGNDTYFGDDMIDGGGIDTLDMSAIMAAITANLDDGFMGRGSVSSSETGNDTIWGIENFVGGWGDDTITAGTAVNVLDGGAGGGDVFRFLSAEHADGDTIVNFQPGDKIDLSAMEVDDCAAGGQTFSLVTEAFTGKGQIMVVEENIDGQDYTVILGNTTGGADADFRLSLKGTHNLDGSDFL